jgi:hypothetical protein
MPMDEKDRARKDGTSSQKLLMYWQPLKMSIKIHKCYPSARRLWLAFLFAQLAKEEFRRSFHAQLVNG